MRKVSFISAIILIISLYLSSGFSLKRVNVVINGQELITESTDISAQIIEGRTIVPLREVFEALGASVCWEKSTQAVTGYKDDIKLILRIGEKNDFLL